MMCASRGFLNPAVSKSHLVDRPITEAPASCRRVAGEKVKTAQDLFAFICTKSILAEYGMIWNVNSVFSITLEAKTLKRWCSRVLKFGNSIGTIWINLVLICFARYVKAKVQDNLVNCQDPEIPRSASAYGNAFELSVMWFCFWMLSC